MKYIKLVISVQDEYQESLIAELSDMEFDGFQQMDDELITYITKERFHVGDRERIEQLLAGFPGNAYIQSEEVVADQNWNQEWEKTIEAQEIGLFLVKPTWSNTIPRDEQILLEIDPKMSFGTGYHETTRLILRQLPEIISEGDYVLDAGTGTGILAIASVKLGATHALAFDIDEWSVSNTRENIYLNGLTEEVITVRKGSAEVVDENDQFNVILANIERNVIAEMLPAFSAHLKPDGMMLLSGLQKNDETGIKGKLDELDFTYIQTFQENEWIAIWAQKPGR